MPDRSRLRPRALVRRYGAEPLRLLALLGCFALAGYAVWHVPTGTLPRIALWFAAAIVAHDLVLFPAYALADRVLALLAGAGERPARRVPVVNHVRVPVLAAALLFVLFLPGIIRQGARTYQVATGQTQQPFLTRWLLLTAVAFAASAAVYAVRLHRATAPRRAARRLLRTTIGPTERLLAVAYSPHTDTPTATATTHALWLLPDPDPRPAPGTAEPAGRAPAADRPPGWRRLGWEDLAELDTAPGRLRATALPGTGAAGQSLTVPVDDPEPLVALARDRVAATRVLTRHLELGPGQRAEVLLRRRPGTGELVWRVRLDPAADPADPGLEERLDEALTGLRDELGLDDAPQPARDTSLPT